MIIIKILGGLGNQMFQYAAAYVIAKKHNTTLKMDLRGLYAGEERSRNTFELEIFNIEPTQASHKEYFPYIRKTIYKSSLLNTWYKRLFGLVGYKELDFSYNDKLDRQSSSNMLLRGLFQSEYYFNNLKPDIYKLYTFPEINAQNKEIESKIQSTNSVSIHIRRGDYVNDKEYNKAIGTTSLDYYNKAIKHIEKKTEKPVYYIFSDSPDWVNENLEILQNATQIDWNTGKLSYIDMQLMSLCKHNIIANSTFSWWGAWLNQNPGKIVIAPSKWFAGWDYNTKDLIPENWIRL